MARPRKATANSSQLRIIGGRWRSRKLVFNAAEGLRPTTDRSRETLFNWLAPYLHDARCLDLFAGSGALGLEALSRGARHCDFVDSSAAVTRQISQHLETLDALDLGVCHCMPATQFLKERGKSYDIVFVDPPFGKGLLESACAALECDRFLSDEAWIYIEHAAQEATPGLPDRWHLYRQKSTGGVNCALYHIAPV
tara:strand:+ start:106519 stop:107106 length:588 start_codon:yes stop_codon:yes gene_type:complete